MMKSRFNGIGEERARNINSAIVYFILFYFSLSIPFGEGFDLGIIILMLLVFGFSIFCLVKSLTRLHEALK